MELFIDVHAHAFNWQHVPIEGFLRSRTRAIGKGAARLNALLIDIASDPELAGVMEQEVRDGSKRTAIAAALFLFIKSKKPVDETKNEIVNIVNGTAAIDGAEVELRGADGDRAHWIEVFLFVLTLLQDTDTIGERLVNAYPEPPAPITLFTNLMMDMELAFNVTKLGEPIEENRWPQPPDLTYPDQIAQMVKLGKHWKGKLVGFVAFDPRRENALELVREALEQGMVGVKVYPPMGYRPYDIRYRAAFDGLYSYCESNGVPVMAHCTATGFEAYRGHGIYSEPSSRRDPEGARQGWDAILEEYSNLRLCLGHAGSAGRKNRRQAGGGWAKLTYPGWGTKNWRSKQTIRRNYALDIVELCQSYPHVYTDFSYMMEILDQNKFDRIKAHLQEEIIGGHTKEYNLAKKIMYGSDWHMPRAVAEDDSVERLRKAFKKLFDGLEEDGLATADDFFGLNACRYLNLQGAVERLHGSENEDVQAMVDTWRDAMEICDGDVSSH